jgi:UDP-N-acetylmuramoyl-L-alanyl-D-glutamate--2,6-diaminopimelate ligase
VIGSDVTSLADCLPEVPDVPDVLISGIAIDSRKVQRGDLFVALAGTAVDGHDFVDTAIAQGAVAILAERPVRTSGVPVVVTTDARRRAGRIAARLTGDPSVELGCIGITGTNGKTSVAYFVAQLLSAVDQPTGYGGTLGWGFGGRLCVGGLTTEDPVTVQRRLAWLASEGARWVALEASSHALAQDRIEAVNFDIAVFTNLTRDHLDYHGDMASYAAAKRKLFEFPSLSGGVVNLDDPLGVELHRSHSAELELFGVGRAPEADIRIGELRLDTRGVRGNLDTPWGRHEVEVPVYGEFAFHNFAMALAVSCLAGASIDRLLTAAATLRSPPGRMEFVRVPQRPVVIVDYAHTPDALRHALAAARAHGAGQLVCVFGCGGDRDPGKRTLMAEAVERCADVAVVTDDNPRSEQPEAIAEAVCRGFSGAVPVEVELDRERAIELAVDLAGPSGMVLVAGKGHESYQEIAGERRPYSDIDAVRRVLEG